MTNSSVALGTILYTEVKETMSYMGTREMTTLLEVQVKTSFTEALELTE